jgi:18S rRNA (adenine1779-N6/adenine1780-N6)-dimethyltransferase
MAIDGAGGGGGGRRRGKVSPEFKDLVQRVLVDGGFDQMRASKMSQEEFIRMLACFNAVGIHFS